MYTRNSYTSDVLPPPMVGSYTPTLVLKVVRTHMDLLHTGPGGSRRLWRRTSRLRKISLVIRPLSLFFLFHRSRSHPCPDQTSRHPEWYSLRSPPVSRPTNTLCISQPQVPSPWLWLVFSRKQDLVSQGSHRKLDSESSFFQQNRVVPEGPQSYFLLGYWPFSTLTLTETQYGSRTRFD